MAGLQDIRGVAGYTAVENKTKALRVVDSPRGVGFALSGTSGVIAAAQAAGSVFFAMRSNPSAGNTLIFIERVRLQYTTLANYTTSITAGRRLSLFRGSGAATSGGTAMTPANVDSSAAGSQASSGMGGDSRIATTAGLTQTGITWEANPIREFGITHLGVAGYQGNEENIFDFAASAPIILQPGQLLGIRNPQAMDAGGTWQMSVDIAFHESVGWGSSVAD